MSIDTLTVPPPPAQPYVRVVPLGGCGEIGRNMTVIETNEDMVVVDCGLMFPDDEMYGVDIVINDFTYVRERAAKLRALLVTHGHEDHIGGIPYFLREFPQTPVVGTPLSIALVKAKSRDHGWARPSSCRCSPASRVRYGSIEAEFVHINHSRRGRLRAGDANAGRDDLSHRRLQVRSNADRRQARRLRRDRANRRRGRALHALGLDERGAPGAHALGANRRRGVHVDLLARQGPNRRRIVRLQRSAHSAGGRPRRAIQPEDCISGALDAQRGARLQRAQAFAHSARYGGED